MTTAHAALLRGINVGGKNKLPMKDLAEIFAKAGGGRVRTFIQSGNVLFDAAPAMVPRITAAVTAQIEARFGYKIPVVVRTSVDLTAVLRQNPFLADEADEGLLHVFFLAERPTPANVTRLDAGRSAPDRFTVRGREVYLCLPNGMGKTKLTNAYFDTKLETVSTGRNWRTIKSIAEMLKD